MQLRDRHQLFKEREQHLKKIKCGDWILSMNISEICVENQARHDAMQDEIRSRYSQSSSSTYLDRSLDWNPCWSNIFAIELFGNVRSKLFAVLFVFTFRNQVCCKLYENICLICAMKYFIWSSWFDKLSVWVICTLLYLFCYTFNYEVNICLKFI